MATTVTMPQLGETVTEGTILRWAKQVGDSVSEDDVLVEISTDKVDTEVPSPAAGVVLEILVAEGETVEVGAALVVIGEAGEVPSDDRGPSVIEVETADQAAEMPAADEPVGDPERIGDSDLAPEPAVAVSAVAPTGASEDAGERTTVTMPQLGETVTEGTILRWAKQVGDSVSEDDVLVEISTDKVDTEVPSPAAGVVLEILVAEGETVEVGAALVVIGSSAAVTGGPAEAAPAIATAPEPVAATASTPEPVVATAAAPAQSEVKSDGGSRFLSPVVRKLAREHGIDIGQVGGTGRNGRVTRNDVLAYIEAAGGAVPAPGSAPAAPVSEEVPPEPATTAAVTEAPQVAPASTGAAVPAAEPQEPPVPVTPSRRGDEIRELDRLRAAIGKNMIKAKQTAAHVWTSVEVDFEHVERVRQAHKADWKAEEGFSLTYLPFIARATLDALRAYPVVNSSFYLEDNKAVYHHDINLGIAVDLNQGGLLVATIRNADDLMLRGIARAVRTLADKSRGGKLDPDDISGSTFTITNPGPFGSFMSAPIINVPNVAILSTDTVTKRPTVVTTADGQDTIAIRHIGYLGLSWDHRAFDGSTAVLFLRRIKENLETWDWEQQFT